RSLDHLVGEREQIVGYLDAKRLGGLHVDDQQEFCLLHDWQVSWFSAFKYLPSIDAGLTIGVGVVDPIAHEAASQCIFTEMVDRRDRVVCRERYELLASRVEEGIADGCECRKSCPRHSLE